MQRKLRTPALIALTTAALLALSAPLSASAHVSLESDTAKAGTFTTLTFRVPNESETASVNKLTLTLPQGKDLLASVSYIPVPGWTTQVIKTKLAKPIVNGDDTTTEAVTQVIWTAEPGSEYAQNTQGIFKLFVGPVPDVDEVKLPVDQGYSDGTVVSWSQGEDADHPAPVLYIDEKAVPIDDPDRAPETSVTASSAPSDAGPDVVARTLGGVGLLLGAIALVIAITGRRRKAGS